MQNSLMVKQDIHGNTVRTTDNNNMAPENSVMQYLNGKISWSVEQGPVEEAATILVPTEFGNDSCSTGH
jgi:hypothetical protein